MIKGFAKFLFWIMGWKVIYPIPPEAQRSVMIGAPHTSNWDFVIVRIAFYILGIPVKLAIKDFWTKFPFGIIIKPMGGLGINRNKDPKKKGKSYVEQMAAFFDQYERIAMVIAPEGTRSKRTQWKTGFYHTAKLAGVPITLGYLDYEKKEAGVGAVVHVTDDMEADMRKIMDFYRNITPRNPDKFVLDERYA